LPTQCDQEFLEFQPLEKREVRGGFDGGAITSDAGGAGWLAPRWRSGRGLSPNLRPVSGTIVRRSASSTGWRSWWRSGVYGLALGYEDLNDHEELRRDPLLGVLTGKADPSGEAGCAPAIGARRWRVRAR